ncbi:MAG: glycosyltransferase family 2 protein [Rhodobacteraceae bacterium]|nr:glycosyltransferase family 2 protein [Paracoccaceae bacterium]MCB1941063.1 glycosyltransferase family 2 protein [Accumulibacter sp.]
MIIVNYNAGALLVDCVRSLLGDDVHQVIVVDNLSADDSLARLESLSPGEERLRIIRNDRNLGFSAACNIGLAAASSERLLFLNPDATMAPQALSRLLEVLDADDTFGMVGGMLCNPDGSEQPGGRRAFPTPGSAFIRAFRLSWLQRVAPRLFADFLLHQEPLPTVPVAVEAISGACMLVKRAAVNDVGPWDEAYFLHCEDLDWCMRFRQKGWQVIFVPDARVVHVWGACSRSRPVFVEWHKHHGMLRFYRKFYRRQYSGLLWALVIAGVWLRFAVLAVYHGFRQALNRLGVARAA